MTRKQWTYVLSLGLALFCLLGTPNVSQAYYDDNPDAVYIRPSSRSIMSVRISGMTGIPDVFGISASITAGRPFELEFGVSSLIFGWTAFGKAGAAIPLLNTRGFHGRGWTIDMQLMGGYRYIATGDLFGPGGESHGITATLGFDFTYWFARRFGITAQITGGAGYYIYSTTANQPFFPDLRFALGLAF